MKRDDIDTMLVAATKRRSAKNSNFVIQTMQQVRNAQAETLSTQNRRTSTQTNWSLFMTKLSTHKLAFGIVAAATISIASFSGYAYAIGSDPVSLMKRWVSGDKVIVQYDGRTFEHGKSVSYSDAAITAHAEMNTIRSLAFKASGLMTVPTNGVEHVTNVFKQESDAYMPPTIGTITTQEGQQVTFAQAYKLGDKMNPSQTIDTTLNTTVESVKFFKNGEIANLKDADKTKPVAIFSESYVQHKIGTKGIQQITVYFVFELKHDLAAHMEADKALLAGKVDVQNQLYEPNWGGLSNHCYNNGADTCDPNKFSKEGNQGMYGATKGNVPGFSQSNPESIAFSEGLANNYQQPKHMLSRALQGKIVHIDESTITLKTSSGAEWKLAYSKQHRAAFNKAWNSELKTGDEVTGMIVESVYNLDNRTIDSNHISSLERVR